MANYNNANGFAPYGAKVRATTYTASATIAAGDLLAMVSGKVLPFVEGTHTAAIGVALAAAVNNGTLPVADDPNQEFVAQTTGSYVKATHDGTVVDVRGTTGVQELDQDVNTNGTLLILAHHPITGSDAVGANARVRVKISKHLRRAESGTHEGANTWNDPTTFAAAVTASKQLLFQLGNGVTNVTATGNITLAAATDAPFQRIDANGASRDVTLPVAAAGVKGLWYEIMNLSAGATNLVVKDGASTIVTVAQNKASKVVCDGTTWRHMGVATIALS